MVASAGAGLFTRWRVSANAESVYLPSRPYYYGLSTAINIVLAGVLAIIAAELLQLAENFYLGLLVPVLILATIASFWEISSSKAFHARKRVELITNVGLMLCAVVAILTTVAIFVTLVSETANFFYQVPFWRFLFGTHWAPLSGMHAGEIDPDTVGAIPLFLGTALITLVAMAVAIPIGLMAAIYLSDFASARVRTYAKPTLEILAGIPTVVYGFFAVVTLAPLLRASGESLGMSVSSESALAAGLVMGIMIVPFISSLCDDVINAVPQSLREGSYGLGATKAETMRKVIIPAAFPGIVSAALLGISRALGETMIVVMAAGQGAKLTFNPLEATTAVTVQIVALITGDTEADVAAGPAYALGLTLLCITLFVNFVALRIVRRYHEAYE